MVFLLCWQKNCNRRNKIEICYHRVENTHLKWYIYEFYFCASGKLSLKFEGIHKNSYIVFIFKWPNDLICLVTPLRCSFTLKVKDNKQKLTLLLKVYKNTKTFDILNEKRKRQSATFLKSIIFKQHIVWVWYWIKNCHVIILTISLVIYAGYEGGDISEKNT